MSVMHQYLEEVEIIPVYINMMETDQKKDVRAKLPICKDMLVAISIKAILVSDRFPRATDAWEEKTDANKTW